MSILQEAIRKELTGDTQSRRGGAEALFVDVLAWMSVVLLVGVTVFASSVLYEHWSALSSLAAVERPVAPVIAESEVLPLMVEAVSEPARASAAVAALYREAQAARPAAAINAAAPAATGTGALEVESRPERDVQAGAPEAEQAEPSTDPALDIAAIVAEAERALAKPVLTEHSAPFLGELAQSLRDAVPSLRYEQHRFESAQPEAAVVLINGREWRAGDNLPNGVRLLEILPDSAVFDYQGVVFRLRALSSWVNF